MSPDEQVEIGGHSHHGEQGHTAGFLAGRRIDDPASDGARDGMSYR